MHANLVRWRLDPSVRDDASYDAFMHAVAQQNVPILRQFGLLDSFVFRISAEEILVANLFDTETDADNAWAEVQGSLQPVLLGRVELIARISARADDLPLLTERSTW
jgi:hypothetical protein